MPSNIPSLMADPIISGHDRAPRRVDRGNPVGGDVGGASGNEAAVPPPPKPAAVLAELDPGPAEDLARAEQEPCAAALAGAEQVRGDPGERGPGHQAYLARPFAGPAQVGGDRGGAVPPVERGDVRGLRRVEQVARREYARDRGAERRVDHRAARPGVELAPGHRRKLVVGDPVSGEDHQVAFDRPGPARVEVGELNLLDPLGAANCADRRPGPHRSAVANRRSDSKAASDWCLANSVTSPATEAPACARVVIAEKLTCSAPTITARRPTLSPLRWTSCWRVEVVITPAGRSPGTSRAERGRSRHPVASTTAGGSISSLPPGPVSFSLPLPIGDHRLRQDLSPRLGRQLAVALGVARSGEDRPQVAEAEAGVVGVARDPTRLALALDHRHRRDPAPPQLDRRGEAGGAAADDHRAPSAGSSPSGSPLIRGDLRSAEEPLAAAHQRPGSPSQAIGIHRRDRPRAHHGPRPG